MRKIAEINCLEIVCRGHPCYGKFGELKKKIVCTVSGGKKFASAQSMVEKNFLPSENHDTPRAKNNGPSLKLLPFSTESSLSFKIFSEHLWLMTEFKNSCLCHVAKIMTSSASFQ